MSNFDLIHTSIENMQPLSLSDLARTAPAIFTNRGDDDRSDKYGHMSTLDSIVALADYGFQPVRAIQRPKRVGGDNFSQHMLTFQNQNLSKQFEGDTAPEIILYNSHDGSSSMKLFGGAFRFICSNGMVAGEGFQHKLTHRGSDISGDFEAMVIDTAEKLPTLMQTIADLKAIRVDARQAVEYTEAALELRWAYARTQSVVDDAGGRGSFATLRTVGGTHTPRRAGDEGMDAYTLYQRTQEALIRGGVPLVSFTKRNPHGALRMATALRSVPDTVKVNRDLWDITEGLLA
jgi:hypothetical protein